MEELLGLWARDETPMATRLLFLALAGLVEGKPMRITLWMGANRPNLGRHWKYLQKEVDGEFSPNSKSFSHMTDVKRLGYTVHPGLFSLCHGFTI